MSRLLQLTAFATQQAKPLRLVGLALLLAVSLTSAARARTFASSLLDVEMTIPSGAITNKFGFATSFPKPAELPGVSVKNGNPGGERKPFTAKGGTASLGPNNPADGMIRKSVSKGRGMKLYIEENTNAMPVDGSIGQAEGWISGRTKFRLGNFTGRPGLPEPPENLKVDLDLQVLYDILATATNDPLIGDNSNAKVVYSLTNTTTGDVIVPETVFSVSDDDVNPDSRMTAAKFKVPTPKIELPSNSFHNLELFSHVYVAGQSVGASPPGPPPVIVPAPAIPALPDRMDKVLPDDEMHLPLPELSLFGDALGHGAGNLLGRAGVVGEAPEAIHGLDTVMLDNVIYADSFFDVAFEVEVPVNDFSRVAIQDTMGAAPGFHGQLFDLQLGTGLGDQFQLSQDPTMLSLAGAESNLPPQELTGAYQLMDMNDPFAPPRCCSRVSSSRGSCRSSNS